MRIEPAQAALAGLTAVALALRVPWLGQSFDLDETITARIIGHGVGSMATGIANQAEAPLYFVVTYAWRAILGHGEVATRFVSLLAGVATVPLGYAAVRVLLNRRAALGAAALLATSPMLVWYSTDARAYSLWLFLCTLSLLFWAHARVRDAWWAFDGWTVASALAFATHYFAIALIVPEAALLIGASPNRRRALRAVGGVALALLMIAPLVEYQRVHGSADWIGKIPLDHRLFAANRAFAVGPGANAGFLEIAVPAVWLASVALALRFGDRCLRQGVLSLAVLGGGALAITLAGAVVGADYILARNLLFLWVPVAGLGAAAAALPRRAGIAGAALVLAICVVFVSESLRHPSWFKRDDWRGVARIVGAPRSDHWVTFSPQFEWPAVGYYSPALRPIHKPGRVAEIDVVIHLGGAPYGGAIGAARPGPPFKPYGPPIRIRTSSVLARFRTDRPTLVDPRSLTKAGLAGSIVLAGSVPHG